MSVVHSDLLIAASDSARPVRVIAQGQALTGKAAAWAEANNFTGKAGQLLILPGDDGAAGEALFGAGEVFEPMSARSLPTRLPAGDWRLDGVEGDTARQAALAFALGGYLFDRYKARPERGRARLVAPAGLDLAETLARAFEARTRIQYGFRSDPEPLAPDQLW
jgi:leucyl aminopeptidase